MFHMYVLNEERNLGIFLSGFDNKNQRVLTNWLKSSIFTPRNIGNPEKCKIKYQQNRQSDIFEKEALQMHLGTLPM